MKPMPKIFGLFFIGLVSVYSGSAKLGDAATSADQPVDAKPAGGQGGGVSVTNTQVAVNDAGAVEIHVNDANLLEVLRMLSLQSRKNIIASKNVTGNVTANLYNVTVAEALDAILQSNGFVYREKGNFIYVYTARELADLDKSARQVSTEVFHLYYTPAANAASMIKPALSPESQVAVTAAAQSGIDITSSDAGGNTHSSEDMLVVTDYTDNLEKVRKILKEVDRRPQQVLVEATILAATLTDNNALGVDFSVMGGVKFGQFYGNPPRRRSLTRQQALYRITGIKRA